MRNTSAHLRGTAALAAALCALAAPAVAVAGDKPPNPHENVSSIDEYIEDIPTASGPVPSTRAKTPPAQPGKAAPEPVKLPPKVERSIKSEGGSDAARLTEIVSTPEVISRPTPAERTVAIAADASVSRAVGDAVTTDDSELIALAFALAAITLGGIAVAAYRRARRS